MLPIFFTRLENGGVHRDERGIAYSSLDDAVRRAGMTAGQVLSDDLAAGHQHVSISVHVESPDGITLATVTVESTVTRYGSSQQHMVDGADPAPDCPD